MRAIPVPLPLQVHASMTQRKRLKQLHWDKIRTVPENSIWSKTPKVCVQLCSTSK